MESRIDHRIDAHLSSPHAHAPSKLCEGARATHLAGAKVAQPTRAEAADAHWVRPALVGEVQFSERTEAGKLRHPVWRGFRPDKKPSDVVVETEPLTGTAAAEA